jgi:hypothetical protein
MDGLALRPGHIVTVFSSTGEETAWKFHQLDPLKITVCTCNCLRAPNIPHICADVEANRMTNDILLGCAAHRDLSMANLRDSDKLNLKKNTSDLGDCDCASSASLPLAFIFRGNDRNVYENGTEHDLSTHRVAKHILEDITSEGSREYTQKGITPIERVWTFHQFPLDVTKTSANFGPYTYRVDKTTSELSRIDYPTLIAEWRGGRARPAPSVPSLPSLPSVPDAAPWGVDVPCLVAYM